MTRKTASVMFLAAALVALAACRTALPEIPNSRSPLGGVLSGGQPTELQIRQAADAGVRTVINLRTDAETGFEWEQALVEQLGMRYVQIPVAGAEGLKRDVVERFDRELTSAVEEGTVLLHCGSGNRIGALFALREAWLRDAEPQAALDFGLAAGLTRLEPAVRRTLGLPLPELIVASDFSNPPFASWPEGEADPRGLEPEMMKLLAESLDRSVVWKRVEFDRLLETLEAGEADVVVATMGITPERAERVAFSTPYHRTHISVVVRRGRDEPKRLDDLAGRRVGAARGTTSERALRQHLPQATPVLDRENDAEWADLLEAGTIDAVLMDEPNAKSIESQRPALSALPQPVAEEHYAIAVRRDDRALLDAINKHLGG